MWINIVFGHQTNINYSTNNEHQPSNAFKHRTTYRIRLKSSQMHIRGEINERLSHWHCTVIRMRWICWSFSQFGVGFVRALWLLFSIEIRWYCVRIETMAFELNFIRRGNALDDKHRRRAIHFAKYTDKRWHYPTAMLHIFRPKYIELISL